MRSLLHAGFTPALLALSLGWANADPLIDIPTARKLPYGDYRIEFADQYTAGQTQLLWVDAGISTTLEATLSAMRFGRESLKTSEDLEYNVISPFPGISPGIGLGVQDLANTSQDGRREYVVITWRDQTQTLDGGQAPFDLTFGTYYRNGFYPFAGLMVPFSHKVHAMIEYDGFRGAGGLEFISSRRLSLRLLFRGSTPLADMVWTSHF